MTEDRENRPPEEDAEEGAKGFKPEVFRKRLDDALWARKMRQADLARKTGMRYKSINAYYKGDMNPSLDALVRLAEALEVSVDFLMGRVDDMNQIAPEPEEVAEEVRFIRRAYMEASTRERALLKKLAQMIIEGEREGTEGTRKKKLRRYRRQ